MIFLAALQPGPATPGAPAIKDIAPPVEIPWPTWLVAAAWLAAAVAVALFVWLVIRWGRRPGAVPPLTPRAAALRELQALRAQLNVLDPYRFSVLVSDVLRHFVSTQYGAPAEQQTSPEFLAAIHDSPAFSPEDRSLLEAFLERCDLVKFARIEADVSTSEALLGSALAFVQGGSV